MVSLNHTGAAVLLLFQCVAVAGCGISAAQRQDITRWEAEAAQAGHPEITFREELDPGRAAGLGFLPFGIGGFYVHKPGLGVSGILCWPLSITWVPAVAYKSANQWNYQQLRHAIEHLRAEAQPAGVPAPADEATRLERIERLWKEGKISDQEHQESRRKVIEDLSK